MLHTVNKEVETVGLNLEIEKPCSTVSNYRVISLISVSEKLEYDPILN